MYEPPTETRQSRRVRANEETAILTPIVEHTAAIDRIPMSQRKRWQTIAATLGAISVLSIGVNIYLFNVVGSWAQQNADLTNEAYDLGDQLATEQTTVQEQTREIDLLGSQLKTANERLVELADEKAQVGDDKAFAEEIAAYQEELSSLAGSVAEGLQTCADERAILIGYLKNAKNYEASDLVAYENGVNKVCKNAKSANDTLQKQLAE